MSALKNLEQTLAGWQKNSPIHLPVSVRKWLADNAWWLVIVGIVGSIISIIGSIRALMWANDVLYQARQFSAALGVDTPSTLGSDISIWVSMAVFVVVIIIELKAIQPLREKKKSGWDLVFLASLIAIAGSLVSGIASGGIVATIFGTAIAALLSWFFLFELRLEYLPKEKKTASFKPATEGDTKDTTPPQE